MGEAGRDYGWGGSSLTRGRTEKDTGRERTVHVLRALQLQSTHRMERNHWGEEEAVERGR